MVSNRVNKKRQVGSTRDLLTQYGSAQNALRLRLRQPRDRVAAPSFAKRSTRVFSTRMSTRKVLEAAGNGNIVGGHRMRRSPESVSIVYPSPSLENLNNLNLISKQEQKEEEEEATFLPSLPYKSEVAYIYPHGDPLIREKKQIPVTPSSSPFVEEAKTSTEIEPETEVIANNNVIVDDNDQDEEYDYSEWETDVSVSKTVSEAFSISKTLNSIAEVVSSTLAPIFKFSSDDDASKETTTIAENLPEDSTTTTTATTLTTATDKSINQHNQRLSNLFKPRNKIHSFLASTNSNSKSATAINTTTTDANNSPTSTRKSFFKKPPSKLAPKFEKNKDDDDNAKNNYPHEDKANVDMKLMKMMNILNSRDMTHDDDKEENVSENSEKENNFAEEIIENNQGETSDDDDETKNEIEDDNDQTTDQDQIVSSLLHNRNERPKFQVPKSLQERLLKQSVVDPIQLPKDEKAPKDKNTASPGEVVNIKSSPLRKPLTPIRPFKPSITAKPPITSRPIEFPKRTNNNNIVTRPNRPLDLDVSPSQVKASQTINRSRLSGLRSRPSSSSVSSSSITKVEVTTTTSTEASTTTEKLTVGEILAGLHGENSGGTKTSTFRPRVFKPKSDTRKLRERLRLQLEDGKTDDDDNANIFNNEEVDENFVTDESISDDDTNNNNDDEESKSETDIQNPGFSSLPNSISRPAPAPRRVIPNRSKISRIASEKSTTSKSLPLKIRPRKPIISREPNLNKDKSVKKDIAEDSEVIKKEHRVLSGEDLLASLGLVGDKSEEIATSSETPNPTKPNLSFLENLFDGKNEVISNEPSITEVILDDNKNDHPASSVKDFLNLAVVETMTISPETTLQTRQPLRPSISSSSRPRSRSRSRASSKATDLLGHRFKPKPASIIPKTSTDSSLASTRSNLINNRLRIRQRGRVVSLQNTNAGGRDQQQISETSSTTRTSESSTEAVIPSTRASSRFRVRQRQPIRRTRPSTSSSSTTASIDSSTESSFTISKTTPTRQSLSRTATNLRTTSTAPTRTSNNSRLRVRTRTRQPLKAFDTTSNSNEETENNNNSELDQQIPIGKLEKSTKSASKTAKSNNNRKNSDEINNKKEEEINIEHSTTAPTSSLRSGSNFKPRFGARQRNAVRTRLKQQLFESDEGQDKDKTEDQDEQHKGDDLITNDIPDLDNENDDEDLTVGFGTTVSSIFGLNAVPAAHFTTTPRFILGNNNVTPSPPFSTPAPSLTLLDHQKDNQQEFLPTLSPLQRVGRSTIGYVDPVQPTEKPKSNSRPIISSAFPKLLKPKRGSRPKFGQKFSTTSSPFEDDNSNIDDVGNIVYGISSTVLPTTTTESTTNDKNNSSSIDRAPTPISVTKPRNKKRKNNKDGGKSLFARPRVDFLKRFNEKIADIERKEKALLESFGGGNAAQKFANKKQPKQHQQQNNRNNKNGNNHNNNVVNRNRISGGINLKRPRRKLTNAGLNEVSTNLENVSDEKKKTEFDTDDDDVIELKYNITLNTAETSKDFANENDLTGKNNQKQNQKSKPTKSFKKPSLSSPPPLPKGFQFPFSKNRFGKHQPKLLSFQIIKSKPDQDDKKKPTSNAEESLKKKDDDDDEQGKSISSSTKKLSLRDKLKFGRKSFGSLLGKQPKKPFFPTPAPKQNTSTTPETTPEVPTQSETTQDDSVQVEFGKRFF